MLKNTLDMLCHRPFPFTFYTFRPYVLLHSTVIKLVKLCHFAHFCKFQTHIIQACKNLNWFQNILRKQYHSFSPLIGKKIKSWKSRSASKRSSNWSNSCDILFALYYQVKHEFCKSVCN